MENFEQFVETTGAQIAALRKKNKPIAPDQAKASWEKQVKLDMDADDREKLPPSPGSQEDLARPFQNPDTHLKSQQAWSKFKPELKDPVGDFENVHGAQGTNYQKADQMNKRFDSEGKEIKNQFKDSVQEYVGRVIRNGQSKDVLMRFGKRGPESSNQINLKGVLGKNAVKNIHHAAVNNPDDEKTSRPHDNPNKYRHHDPTRTPKHAWIGSKPAAAEDLESMLAVWKPKVPEPKVPDAVQPGADEGEAKNADPGGDGWTDLPPADDSPEEAPVSKRAGDLESHGLTQDDVERAHQIANKIVRQGSFGQVSAEDKALMRQVKRIMRTRPGSKPMIAGVRFSNGAANVILKASAMIEGDPITEGFSAHMLRPSTDDEMNQVINLTKAGIPLKNDRVVEAASKRVKHRHSVLGYNQLSAKEREWLR